MAANVIRFISESRVKSLLQMRDLIPTVEEALGRFSNKSTGGVIQPVRAVVPVQKHAG